MTYDSVPQKQCSSCGEYKPATTEYFYKHKKGLYGVDKKCRECKRKYDALPEHQERRKMHQRKRRENPEQREKDRAYDRAHAQTPEYKAHKSTYGKQHRQKPEIRKQRQEYERQRTLRMSPEVRERRRQYAMRWRMTPEGKAYVEEYNKAYAETERGAAILRCNHAKRRARVEASTEHFTPEDVKMHLRTQKGKCWWCGKSHGDDWEVDHRIPLAKGGSNGARNICISCRDCNRKKRAKLPHEWNGRLL